MTFRFPPKEVLEKALNVLSDNDKKEIREQYLHDKEETKEFWRKRRKSNLEATINDIIDNIKTESIYLSKMNFSNKKNSNEVLQTDNIKTQNHLYFEPIDFSDITNITKKQTSFGSLSNKKIKKTEKIYVGYKVNNKAA